MSDPAKPAPEADAKTAAPVPATAPPQARARPLTADAIKTRAAMKKANADPKVKAIREELRRQAEIKTSKPAPPIRRVEHRADGSEVRPYTRSRKPKG